jgi:outer membrane immunogenic protein
MRQILSVVVGATVLSVACSSAAFASPAPAIFNWTGFYVGLNAGGFRSSANANTATICTPTQCYFIDTNTTNLFNSIGAQRDNPSGFIGGAQAGFNWQIGNVVTGLESDFQSFKQNGSGSGATIYPTLAPSTFTVSQSFSTDWLWTLRPRLGIASNNWLFYATGGLAVTQVKANWLFVDVFADTEAASMSRTKAGWTIGAGAEYAFLNGWSLKAEYLHLDFGNMQTTTNNLLDSGTTPVPAQLFLHNISLTSDVFRIGANYKIGSP